MSTCTLSFSTSLRALVSALAGWPSLSSRMTSTLRPAICQPLSSQKSSQPLYMSLPAAAMAPDSGERKPILIGPGAGAAPTATSNAASVSSTTRPTIRMLRLPEPLGAGGAERPTRLCDQAGRLVVAVAVVVLVVVATVAVPGAVALRAIRDARAGGDHRGVDGDVVDVREPDAVGILGPRGIRALVVHDREALDLGDPEHERGIVGELRGDQAARGAEGHVRPLQWILGGRCMDAVGVAGEVGEPGLRLDVEPWRAGTAVGAVAIVEVQIGDHLRDVGD